MAKLHEEMDNCEFTANNNTKYKNLEKTYKEYQDQKESLKLTEESITEIKNIINKKQGHTKNCLDALTLITTTKNQATIKSASQDYTNNINAIQTIKNNLKKELNDNINATSDVIVTNNSTDGNNTNDIIINGESATKKGLKYTALAAGIGGTTLLIGGLILYGIAFNTAMSAIVNTVFTGIVVGIAAGTESGTVLTAAGILTEGACQAIVESLSTISFAGTSCGFVAMTLSGIGAIVAVLAIACLISYLIPTIRVVLENHTP